VPSMRVGPNYLAAYLAIQHALGNWDWIAVDARTIEAASPWTSVRYRVGSRGDGRVKHRIYIAALFGPDLQFPPVAGGWQAEPGQKPRTVWHWTAYQAITAFRSPTTVSFAVVERIVASERSILAQRGGATEPLDDAGLGVLATYLASRRERSLCLALGANHSLGDLRRWLAGSESVKLASAFNTARRVRLVADALSTLTVAADRWTAGTRDHRFQWISRDTVSPEVLGRALDTPGVPFVEVELRTLLSQLLPLLSVELVIQLARTPAAPRAALIASMRRIGQRVAARAVMPWDAVYPPSLALLPLSATYAVDSSPRMLRTVLRLNSAGAENLGHLAVLQQDVWSLIRSSHVRQWIRLRQILQVP
jgi:hypothetical protein